MSYKDLVEQVEERVASPSFSLLLKERELLLKEKKRLQQASKGRWVSPDKPGPADRRAVVDAWRDSAWVVEDYLCALADLDLYRAFTAEAALRASQARQEEERSQGTWLEYEGDRVGPLVKAGEYPIGSCQWHEQRRTGVGGSDVGKIMRYGAHGTRNRRALLLEKTGATPAPEPREADEDLTSATGRGAAWEEMVRYMFADRHPDKRVAYCKASWQGEGEHSWKHANFDGLLLDADGVPEGVLEVKTGTWDPDTWGPGGSIFNAPAGYRAQALWYAMCAELRYGYIAALLDDRTYVEYSFSMDDPKVQAECEAIRTEVDRFWKEVQAGPPKVAARRRPRAPRPSAAEHRHLAAYLGTSVQEAASILEETTAELGEAEGLLAAYTSGNPLAGRKMPLVGVDLETTAMHPGHGHIIETGVVALKEDGSTCVKLNELHSIRPKVLQKVGAGDVETHRITEEMLSGRRPFRNPGLQLRLMDLLEGSVLVAHNAGFEDRWLATHLEGYLAAREEGRILLLDTMRLARLFMPEAPDATLRSFAELNGVPYVSAHAAAQDADMMMRALHRFMTVVHRDGRHSPLEVTEAQRAQAEADVVARES